MWALLDPNHAELHRTCKDFGLYCRKNGKSLKGIKRRLNTKFKFLNNQDACHASNNLVRAREHGQGHFSSFSDAYFWSYMLFMTMTHQDCAWIYIHLFYHLLNNCPSCQMQVFIHIPLFKTYLDSHCGQSLDSFLTKATWNNAFFPDPLESCVPSRPLRIAKYMCVWYFFASIFT